MCRICCCVAIVILFLGCTKREEPVDHPEPCYFSADVSGCVATQYPGPISYQRDGGVPGLPPLDDTTKPFTIELSSPIDQFMVMDHTVAIFEGTRKIPRTELNYIFSKGDQKLEITPISGRWRDGVKYTVVMSKQLVDQNNVTYQRPASFELICNNDPLRDQEGMLLPGLTEELEQWIIQKRPEVQGSLATFADRLQIRTDDIILMWQYQFSNPTVCFKEERIQNCKDHPYPHPSNYLYDTLPEALSPEISRDQGVVIYFSETPDFGSVAGHLNISEVTESGSTPLEISTFDITFVDDQKQALSILPKTGMWDRGKKYRIVLGEGVTNDQKIPFAPSQSYFLMGSPTSLTGVDGLTNHFTSEEITDLETLRQRYQPVVASLGKTILFLEITFGSNSLVPCLLERDREGCSDPVDFPVPSDQYRVEKEGVWRLQVPVQDQYSLPLTFVVEGMNQLDGWSPAMPFSVRFSKDVDESILKNSITVYRIDGENLVESSVVFHYSSGERVMKIYPETLWVEGAQYLVVLSGNGDDAVSLSRPMLSRLIFFEEALVDGENNSRFPGISDELARLGEAEKLRYTPLKTVLTNNSIDLNKIAAFWPITIRKPTAQLTALNSGIQQYNPVPDFPEDLTIEFVGEALTTRYPMINREHTAKIVETQIKLPGLISGLNNEINQPLLDKLIAGETLVDDDLRSVPVIVVLPRGEEINGVVFFLHEYTRYSEDVIAIVDRLNQAGYVVVGVDYRKHGNRVSQVNRDDLRNNITGEKVPDGLADQSGQGFFGSKLDQTRNLIIHTVVEQLWAIRIMKGLDFGASFNLPALSGITNHRIYLIGHGLGGALGGVLGGMDGDIEKVVLNNSGALFSEVLSASSGIGADIEEMLGEPLDASDTFEGRLMQYALQNLFDDVDQYNYRKATPDVLIQSGKDDPYFPEASLDAMAKRWGVTPVFYEGASESKFWHYFTFLTTSGVAAQSVTDIITFLNGE